MTARHPKLIDACGISDLSERLQDIIRRRGTVLGPGYQFSETIPVEFVSSFGAHLIDSDGNDYLDAYNNVPGVGHAHRHVVDAVSRQIAAVNNDTRYPQEPLVAYAERLLATFPAELSKLSLPCTGSEANDLAIRVARFHTGGEGIIATRWAFHGRTREVASFSPMLGVGSPLGPNVRLIDAPDRRLCGAERSLEQYMWDQVRSAIIDLERHGYRLAALIADSAFTSDGIFTHPVGFMQAMVDEVHAAGGLYIADEVQSGFAQFGDSMWGFSRHGIIPDIVTMGKAMGNGFPISGVVFRPEVSDEFGQKVSYFNTLGGRSISVAAASAVLDVFEQENVRERVVVNGATLLAGLETLTRDSPYVAEIRGGGLYLGIEIVKDRATLESDPIRCERIIKHLRDRRVLISRAGPAGNVLKVRPPVAFTAADVSRFLETFAIVAKQLL
ncbi:aspartate aminotransferase family protein [Mesorhizobium sp. LSHC412B00]|uniref:aspartate aminotransferase family protein n=1 Tax=Mesorhizobium sp. LSHC412B00 TaxID=1287285 RepID=UPI0003CEDBA8|nr:aspartate aminotransferase family protein [Mesorhizobium sp. LSHC412B00]ESX81725.1 4-aminobutyrate aminotransferase [Mesorhizobium sp. LSHC412B00]